MLIALGVYFLLYSFLGWILDTTYRSITDGKYSPKSFLPVPLCPVYGFGALFVIFVSRLLGSMPWIFEAIVFGVFMAGLEYVTGFILLKFFHQRLWKYKKTTMNVGQFTDLLHAVFWGILSILVIRLHPMLESIIHLSV